MARFPFPMVIIALGVSLGSTGCGDSRDRQSTAIPDFRISHSDVWRAESDAIEVRWSAYPQGSIRFQNPREKLTGDQQWLAEQLHVIQAGAECLLDGAWAGVSVMTDGTAAEYRAAQMDRTCGEPGTFVGYDELEAFLGATSCVPAYNTGNSLDRALELGVDNGCYGLMADAANSPAEWWFLLWVAVPGSYRFSFDACGGIQPSATLFDASGANEIAGTPAGAGDCPTLTATIPATASYALRVTSRATTRSTNTFYVRVDPSR